MKNITLTISYLVFFFIQCTAQENIIFRTQNEHPDELATIKILEKLLANYDLSKWIFTKEVLIDKDAIPHSHPILTLHTRYLGDKNGELHLLSTFIHEQIHWHLVAKETDTNAAIEALRKKYKNVPIRGSEGARNEYSTYLHLIVCSLEYSGMEELANKAIAQEVMESKTYYTWVYKTIIKDKKHLQKLIKKHHLEIK
ncbi:MAG: hypothetical protein SFU99_10740 [Saprospiraceae bacterium]|nr:hypothetical protein [Saprospiraceae bacterium]